MPDTITSKLTDIEKIDSPEFHDLINQRFLPIVEDFKSTVTKKDNILIYRSKGGDHQIELNFKARDMYGNAVVCRHINHIFFKYHSDKTIHDRLGSIESLEAIDEIRTNDVDNTKLYFSGHHYYLFDSQYFGKMLYHIKQNIRDGESKSFILRTKNHAMTIVISVKHGVTIIKWYDPNFTNIYLRAIVKDDLNINSLSINDFISSRLIQVYQIDKFSLALITYDTLDNEEKFIIKIQDEFNKIISFMINSPINVYYYLLNINYKLEINEENIYQIFNVLSSDQLMTIYYGQLFFIIFNNIFESVIDNKLKLKIIDKLHQENKESFNVLLHAHTKIAKSYLRFIISLTIKNDTKKIDFLLHQDYDLKDILVASLQHQCKDIVTDIFKRVVDDTTLTITQKLSLLKVPHKDKTMLAHFAAASLLGQVQLNAIKLYLETVLACPSLSFMHKLKLLLATNTHGQSVIAIAQSHGQQQLLDLYHNLIESTDKLKDSEKALLGHHLTPTAGSSSAVSVVSFFTFGKACASQQTAGASQSTEIEPVTIAVP